MAAGAVAGFGFKTITDLKAADEQERALREQASVSEQNALFALDQVKFNADILALQAKQVLDSAEVQYTASGVDSDSGSAMAVLANSRINSEMDRLSVLYGGDIRAKNFRTQASALTEEAGNIEESKVWKALAGGLQTGSAMYGMGGGGAQPYESGGGGGYGSAGGNYNSMGNVS